MGAMKRKQLTHAQVIALGYFIIIVVGTALLLLPVSAASGRSAAPLQALFTAVSASCVTGLVLVDTGSFWSPFGQVVILLLIQLGGLGFMTIATLFFRLVRRRMSMRQSAVMAESINTERVGRVQDIARNIAHGSIVVELAGALLLSFRFVPQLGFGRGLWYAVFHSVSAFCNAGFDLFGVREPFCSLVYYYNDPLVILTISALVILGGAGFLVWEDILHRGLNWRRYELQTKLVLVTSGLLLALGTLGFFLFERRRMNAGMSFGEQLLVSFFSAVTPRTAGFNSVDTAALSPASRLLTIMLMFIGGSSGSTAGGVKTTTLAVVLIFLGSGVMGRRGAYVFGRRVPDVAMKRACIVLCTNLLLALFGALFILAAQDLPSGDVLFEVFSAIGTVGMTTGITRELSTGSALIVALLMYCGRVGSVSFATALAGHRYDPPVTYPEESITVG